MSPLVTTQSTSLQVRNPRLASSSHCGTRCDRAQPLRNAGVGKRASQDFALRWQKRSADMIGAAVHVMRMATDKVSAIVKGRSRGCCCKLLS